MTKLKGSYWGKDPWKNGPSDAPPDRVTECGPRYWGVEIDLWPGLAMPPFTAVVSGAEWPLASGKLAVVGPRLSVQSVACGAAVTAYSSGVQYSVQSHIFNYCVLYPMLPCPQVTHWASLGH